MGSATMTKSSVPDTPVAGSSGSAIKDGEIDSQLDAMLLLDKFLAQVSPYDAPVLIAKALAKRKVEDLTASSLERQSLASSSALSVVVKAQSVSTREEAAHDPQGESKDEEDGLQRLKDKGFLASIPLRSGDPVRTELSKLSNQCLSPVTTLLVKHGYDIRLGEKGRTELKQEISRKIREDPRLKESCSQIARLKQANIHQLIQLAEVCGSLDKALTIAQQYWKDTCRRSRQLGATRPPGVSKTISSDGGVSRSSDKVTRDCCGESVATGVAAPLGITIKTTLHCTGTVVLNKERRQLSPEADETETSSGETSTATMLDARTTSRTGVKRKHHALQMATCPIHKQLKLEGTSQ